jgi:hypothetical protein
VGDHIDYSKPATETEKEALRRRFASLKFAGRYWNPYVEWREQGAWVSAADECLPGYVVLFTAISFSRGILQRIANDSFHVVWEAEWSGFHPDA